MPVGQPQPVTTHQNRSQPPAVQVQILSGPQATQLTQQGYTLVPIFTGSSPGAGGFTPGPFSFPSGGQRSAGPGVYLVGRPGGIFVTTRRNVGQPGPYFTTQPGLDC